MGRIVDVYFPPLPTNLSSSDQIRRWDHAVVGAGLAFAVAFALCSGPLSRLADIPTFNWPSTALTWLTLGSTGSYREITSGMWLPHAAGFLTWLAATGAAVWAFRNGLRPQALIRHVSGFRRWDGVEAIEHAKIQSELLCGDQEPFMRLHPLLPLPKTVFTRHGFIYGSVGSGKTQILMPLAQSLVKRNIRALIYDVKGDFTAILAGAKSARIMCPWDARSVRWDIAADVDSADLALAFASGLIPASGSDSGPWNAATQDILAGVIISLQNEFKRNWGWKELADRLLLPQPELHGLLERHHPNAARLIQDPRAPSTSSLLMNVSAHTRLVVGLAQAWPNSDAEGFSWRSWVKATSGLRARQIFVQPGPDRQASSAFIAAMVSVISATVCSPELPDDEHGRTLFFLFDELTSIGKFDLPSLIDKGRSKGACVWSGLQDLGQLREIYGTDIAGALAGMVGTHIVAQIQMSETRKEVAELFGYRRVAMTNLTTSFSGQGRSASHAVSEESRAIVDHTELTSELGVRRSSAFKSGFAVRAIVSLGQDPLTLEWPGIKWKKTIPSRVQAKWTFAPELSNQVYHVIYGKEGTDKPVDMAAAANDILAMIQAKLTNTQTLQHAL